MSLPGTNSPFAALPEFVSYRGHALIGCRKFGKQVQAPSLQRGELFAAREQRVINDVEWIAKPAFRQLLGRISVEGLCFGQNSLPTIAISYLAMNCSEIGVRCMEWLLA